MTEDMLAPATVALLSLMSEDAMAMIYITRGGRANVFTPRTSSSSLAVVLREIADELDATEQQERGGDK